MTLKRPIQIVEVQQPRCALRFGVAPCPAAGSPKCYNTYATCPTNARSVYDGSGMIRWRFVANRPGLFAWGDFSDPDDVATNGIPVNGLTVSTAKSVLNVGGLVDGKSPFGVRATATITMDDFVWDDPVGDFYLGARTGLPRRMFWQVFVARVKMYSNIRVLIYEGNEGDALAAMRQRLYLLDGIDGPVGGKVTLRCIDPLMLANNDRALFPPQIDAVLTEDVLSSQIRLRVSTDASTDLSAIIGLTTRKFVIVESEVIEYTGIATISPGIYQLNGVTRGVGGTIAADHEAGTPVGRVGHFAQAYLGDAALYLLQNWTEIDADLIDATGWAAEAATWLSIHATDAWVTEPTGVEDLMGELCQQAPMYVWWDEFARKVKMRALRPETAAVPLLTDQSTILADSGKVTRDPTSRFTRVFVYYGPIDVTSLALSNFRFLAGTVFGDAELPDAGGAERLIEIAGRWVGSRGQGSEIGMRLLNRYSEVPETMVLQVSAKDQALGVGTEVDISTRLRVDSEGKPLIERWQVVSWEVVAMGQAFQLTLQPTRQAGRYANEMAAGANDYASATPTEMATGGYMCADSGLMADGSAPYLMQ